ncbi:MAG: hypothetical protein ACK4SA_07210 [Caldilinea sp.]
MARLGFKKSYVAGALDTAAVAALFASIKTTLIDSGFTVVLDSPNAIDVVPVGVNAAAPNDDAPHWAFTYDDQGGTGQIQASAVFGVNYLDAGALLNTLTVVNPEWLGSPSPAVTLWFAADGAAGWWWLHALADDANSSTGVNARFACAGVTTRRYPADQYQGLSTRYGLWDPWGDFYPAYARQIDGSLQAGAWTGTWSPFGEGWTNNGQRHAGSPLPKMAVPQFPNRDGNAACLYGEFNEILILTDGYAQEETVLPGWVAMTGSERTQPYAVPAPASFTVL